MLENPTEAGVGLVELASEVVSAYVSNNHVAPTDLPALIASVHASVAALATGSAAAGTAEPAIEKPSSAQIRKSVARDALISFIDGKPYKTLKRHLTTHGLDPRSYRVQFGLPADYPMVAASYSERRSNLAKAAGLGVQRGRGTEVAEAAPAAPGRKKAS